MEFEDKFFQKITFTKEDIDRSFENALRDLHIAENDSFSEVRFSYSYQAMLKAGIVLLAKFGGVRVKSIPGHHIKILQKMSEILKEPDVYTIGNAMRMKRNTDLYSGGELISDKEADEYFQFVKKSFKQVKVILGLDLE